MKILFIEAGATALERFVYQCSPPLGLMYLASYLREKRPHHTLSLFDMMAARAAPESVDEWLKSFSPGLVAIHAMSFHASCMHAVAARVKAWNKECVVAVGGPHPSAAPDLVISDSNVDVAGVGEGEETFLEIMDRVEAGEELAGIPGTVVKRDGDIVHGPFRAYLEDLDKIPFPAWDLVDLSNYFTDAVLNGNNITCRKEVTNIITSRACSFQCIYCHNLFGKKFRPRSVDNVLDEMETLCRDHGIREFHVYDDCFNSQVDRAQAIMCGILDRGLDLKLAFPNGIRGDRLPDDLISAMKEAGTYAVDFGAESGSKRVLKVIRKGLDLDIVRDAITRTVAQGIFCNGFFMLGFPDETEEEMRETIDFACSSDLHTAAFALLSPFPGTEVFRVAEKSGKKVEFDPDDTSYVRITMNLTACDDATLMRMFRLAHWKFYGSPKRIYRIISSLPHPSDLVLVGIRHFRYKFL